MYNITGWSGGGRRPLSYNLMPGQFRNTRVNVFSNPTIINNNIGGFGGCYDYDCGCGCGGSNKMSWMDWTMMGGMLLNGLGNIFACFWGGSGGGAEKTQAKPADDTDLKNLRTLYKNEYNIIQNSDNSFSARPKAGGKTITASTATELMELLDSEPSQTARTDRSGNVVTSELERQLQEAGITRTPDGKYKVNNVEYETLALAMQAVRDDNGTAAIGSSAENPIIHSFQNGANITVKDDLLPDGDIAGPTTLNPDGSFKIKSATYTFTYAATDKTIEYDGKFYKVYKCQGATRNSDGKNMSITDQEYICINGQLVQPSGLKKTNSNTNNYLDGLGIGTIKKETVQRSQNVNGNRNVQPANRGPITSYKVTYHSVKNGKPYITTTLNGTVYKYTLNRNTPIGDTIMDELVNGLVNKLKNLGYTFPNGDRAGLTSTDPSIVND